jgi:hypothetical protein
VEEAFEEGQGLCMAVESMMVMIVIVLIIEVIFLVHCDIVGFRFLAVTEKILI